jgi:hypothetical protein
MTTYGRNFGFRIAPQTENRFGRFSTPAAGNPIPIGVPVMADTGAGIDPLGNQILRVAPAGTLTTATAMAGILVYEYAPAAFAGFDPLLTTYSDLGVVPLGKAAQVIAGSPSVKFWLANTVAASFLGSRNYAGRTMVPGIGATPTVQVGNFLIPGTGDDVNGWWNSTATQAGAWAVITSVDTVRAEVEARILF